MFACMVKTNDMGAGQSNTKAVPLGHWYHIKKKKKKTNGMLKEGQENKPIFILLYTGFLCTSIYFHVLEYS